MTGALSPLAEQIKENAGRVRDRIFEAASKAGRQPTEIRLVAVTKTHPLDVVEAAIEADIIDLGENYAQEFEVKYEALGSGTSAQWHFIGNLQSNKATMVTGRCALVQTIDRKKIASTVSRIAGERDIVQDVLVQMRLGDEETKAGAPKSEVAPLCEFVANLPSLRLRGLMGIAPLIESDGTPAQARKYFDQIKEVFDTLHVEKCDILSIGMSVDYLDAIAAGSTMVRIGSALFGARSHAVAAGRTENVN